MFNAYSKTINKKYSRTGSLFQKHLHRVEINEEKYFRNLTLYIHLNPEKHKIFNDFREYPYSSYKAYISDKPSMIKRDEVFQYFGDIENFIYNHNQRKIRMDGINEIEDIDY